MLRIKTYPMTHVIGHIALCHGLGSFAGSFCKTFWGTMQHKTLMWVTKHQAMTDWWVRTQWIGIREMLHIGETLAHHSIPLHISCTFIPIFSVVREGRMREWETRGGCLPSICCLKSPLKLMPWTRPEVEDVSIWSYQELLVLKVVVLKGQVSH